MIALWAPGNLGLWVSLWVRPWGKVVIQAIKGNEATERWGGILIHPGPLATIGLFEVRSWPLSPNGVPLVFLPAVVASWKQ